jgi:hypothetical protein
MSDHYSWMTHISILMWETINLNPPLFVHSNSEF